MEGGRATWVICSRSMTHSSIPSAHLARIGALRFGKVSRTRVAMATLVLDTFPNLSAPILAKCADGIELWVMDREQMTQVALPPSIQKVCFAHFICEPQKTDELVMALRNTGYNAL